VRIQYLSIAVTAVDLTALTVCLGALACRLWLLPATGVMHEIDADILFTRLWQTLGVCIAALTLSSVMLLFVRTAMMSGRPLLDTLSILPLVIVKTHFGKVWMIRFVGLGLAWLGWFWDWRSLQSWAAWALILVAAALIAVSRSTSGHAADAGDFTLAETIDWLHIVMVSAWSGALVVVSLVLLPAVLKLATRRRVVIATLARRLSTMAGVALSGVLLTGVFNAWRELNGSFSALWNTSYGQLLSIKLLLVLAMIGLGAINRYRFVPLLHDWAGLLLRQRGLIRLPQCLRTFAKGGKKLEVSSPSPVWGFARTARIEAILMLGVLMATAVLLHVMPVH
jgi:copper resistance protein D